MNNKELSEKIIEDLYKEPDRKTAEIIEYYLNTGTKELCDKAASVCNDIHGNTVFLRGLVEFTNYCAMDCLYCGIRHSNGKAVRYRMRESSIVETALAGFEKGFRTFVFQGGEDPFYTTDMICRIVSTIKNSTGGEAAITLSEGIRSREDYKAFREAGADRYLIRFETSDPLLHKKIRNGITLQRRIEAILDLKSLDFETGSGYMTGLPGETEETGIRNARLCRMLELDMIGIGPFIPHKDTPLGLSAQMPFELCIRATALLRLLVPSAHIPATTAAGSIDPEGREKMLKAGANVLMINITPDDVKKHYLLYPGKVCLEEEGETGLGSLTERVKSVNRVLSYNIGSALRKS